MPNQNTDLQKYLTLAVEASQKRDWDTALKNYEEVNKIDPDNIPALSSRAWILATINNAEKDPDRKKELKSQLSHLYKKTIEVINPKSIWAYTPQGQLETKALQEALNGQAWFLSEEKDKASLNLALKKIDEGLAMYSTDDTRYMLDTKVRVLLKLDRKDEAYQIVEDVLLKDQSFGDFQDIKKSADYKNWIKKTTPKVTPALAKKLLVGPQAVESVFGKLIKKASKAKNDSFYIPLLSEYKKYVEVLSSAKLELNSYIFTPPQNVTLEEAVEEQDGHWASRFQGFFCGLNFIAAREDEGSFFISYYDNSIYSAHQDDWGFFYHGISIPSLAFELWDEDESKENPTAFSGAESKELRAALKIIEKTKRKPLPPHLEPLKLFPRTEWLTGIFLGISIGDKKKSLKKAAPLALYKKEKKYLKDYPHLLGYWLWSHFILDNQEELEEILLLAKGHTSNFVQESYDLIQKFRKSQAKIGELDTTSLHSYRDEFMEIAPRTLFGKGAVLRQKEQKKKNEEELGSKKALTAQLEKGGDEATKEWLKKYKEFTSLKEPFDFTSYSFNLEDPSSLYGLSKETVELYKSLLKNIPLPAKDIVYEDIKFQSKYKDGTKSVKNGIIYLFAKSCANFDEFDNAISKVSTSHYGYGRKSELYVSYGLFDTEKAYDKLEKAALEWSKKSEDFDTSTPASTFDVLIKKKCPQAAKVIAYHLEHAHFNGSNWNNSVNAAFFSRGLLEYKDILIPGLKAAYAKNLGRLDDFGRLKVSRSLYLVGGEQSKSAFEEKLKKLLEEKDFNDLIEKDYYSLPEIALALSGLLFVEPQNAAYREQLTKLAEHFITINNPSVNHISGALAIGCAIGDAKIKDMLELFTKLKDWNFTAKENTKIFKDGYHRSMENNLKQL